MKMSLQESIQRFFRSTANVAIIVDLSLEKDIYETIGYVIMTVTSLRIVL